VSELVFGENPINFRYLVVVCPKCRQHAQIIETGKNTLRCQHCGSILQARRLRIFYSSEELAEAVSFRTLLQAKISGKGSETFSLEPPTKKYELSKSGNEDVEKTLELSRNRLSENRSPKNDQKSIFRDLLEAAGGKMEIKELQQKALEKGMIPEKFDLILKKLLETGELYSPEPGMIKMV
jgi:ribosomal protein S27E